MWRCERSWRKSPAWDGGRSPTLPVPCVLRGPGECLSGLRNPHLLQKQPSLSGGEDMLGSRRQVSAQQARSRCWLLLPLVPLGACCPVWVLGWGLGDLQGGGLDHLRVSPWAGGDPLLSGN